MFAVIHEDEALLLIRKPAGIHVHPTPLSPGETSVLDQLRAERGVTHYPLHRLDRPTCGLLLLAKDRGMAASLGEAWRNGRVGKSYVALVRGWFPAEVLADSPVADEDGGEAKPSCTHLVCLERHEWPFPLGRHASIRTSLVLALPRTGRRHQIRRHLARSAHPIIGDMVHGDRHHNHWFQAHQGLGHLQLFAVGLGFDCPASGRWREFRDWPQPAWAPLLERAAGHRVESLASWTGYSPPGITAAWAPRRGPL